jgi:KAP family P-loop domain/Papain family cysteine protease
MVVGAVWTHWLADRRVEVPGVTLDHAYATELYHECQRREGNEIGSESGAQLITGTQVLESRGLVDHHVACEGMQDMATALLEQGPVAAGMSWHESMFQPERIGGVSVCRRVVSSSVVGGHAVLMNGIALDLELGGVTGFVRFKNSWGRSWGDGGQCLISMDDLEEALEEGAQFLLAFPAPDRVATGASAEIAPEGAPPEFGQAGPPAEHDAAGAPAPNGTAEASEREVVRYEQEAIGSDLWTTDDSLGYGIYADAIARGIQHPDTKPPVTIGIKAPWGAGKTSLMRMVQRRLEWPDDPRRQGVREIRVAGRSPDSSPVTNRAVLRRAKSSDGERPPMRAGPATAGAESRPRDASAWRPTVWFNPWMYQTGEQVWAGFAHEIVTQITDRMRRGDRERFWLELNLRRVDEQAVRRRVYSLVFERVLPWALGGAVFLVLGLVLLLAGLAGWAAGAAATAGPLLIAALVSRHRVLHAGVSGSLAAVVQPAAATAGRAAGPLRGALDDVLPAHDYASRSGSFHLIQSDVQHVIDLVATDHRPVVIFIDDLDRCSPGTVVQVIEAINLFLAGQFQHAIFVVAIEPEMVAAHIEAAYADLVVKLASAGGSADLGWRFLEKFIQLPLTLPLIEPERAADFAGSLFRPPGADEPEPPAGGTPRADDPSIAAAGQMLAGESLAGAYRLAEDVASGGAVGEALRTIIARKLSSDDPEMQRVLAYGARSLRPNPREIKRFANVFRFLVMIATERRLANLEAPDELAVLAKLAVLTTRWPSVLGDLAQSAGPAGERTLFDVLEDPPRSAARGPARRAALELQRLQEEVARCDLTDEATKLLLSEEMRRFMCAPPRVAHYADDWV